MRRPYICVLFTQSRLGYTYTYPRPALTVDCVVFGWDGESLCVLLIERKEEPYAGMWALPGGFVGMEEELEEAARRELEEETGLRAMYMEQLYTFGGVGRDPRGRVVTVAWYALIDLRRYARPRGGTDARAAAWYPMQSLPALAFDHAQIISTALARLRGKIEYKPIGFELLPSKFSIGQLQKLYETILGAEFDRRNFRKKLLSLGILIELEEYDEGVPHRAARLYSFDAKRYRQLEETGFQFNL